MKKILLVDMDGVIVDFRQHMIDTVKKFPELKEKYKDELDHIPGIFRYPKPMTGAIEAILKLHNSDKYDIFIATSAPWGNPESSTDKRYWIEKYFNKLFYKRLFITHRKDLLIGDYLIDDRLKNGAAEFKGELLPFGYNHITDKMNKFETWDDILKYLL